MHPIPMLLPHPACTPAQPLLGLGTGLSGHAPQPLFCPLSFRSIPMSSRLTQGCSSYSQAKHGAQKPKWVVHVTHSFYNSVPSSQNFKPAFLPWGNITPKRISGWRRKGPSVPLMDWTGPKALHWLKMYRQLRSSTSPSGSWKVVREQ